MSQTSDNIKITGEVDVHLYNETETISRQIISNLVVNAGKEMFIKRLIGATGATGPNYMALGTGNTGALVTQTNLQYELGGSRVAFNSGYPTLTQTSITFQSTWPAGTATSSTINEAGIFQTGSTGASGMLCRTVFNSTINKTASDILTVSWTITIN